MIVHPSTTAHVFEHGDDVVLHRVKPLDHPQMTAGYRVIRNTDEWAVVWRDKLGPAPPPLPPKLDLQKQMLLWARGDDSRVTLRIARAIRDGGVLHVYVDETTPGENCRPPESLEPPVDMASVSQMDVQVQFHVARAPSAPCGKAPEVAVECKVKGGAPSSDRLAAAAGDVIECDATRTKPGGSTGIVDRNWFAKWPDGSAAKLTYEAEARRVTFTTDAYGTYAVTFEAVDEDMKRAQKTINVDVLPPMDELLVQVSWGGFESGDDPETFPRLEAKVIDRPDKEYLEPTECVLDAKVKPLWCKSTANGIAKHFHVLTEVGTDYLVQVRYVDERVDKGPFVCVTTFSLGTKIASVCDKLPRRAGEIWDVGRYLAKQHIFEVKR